MMNTTVAPPSAREIRCFCCGRYLGTIDTDGGFMRFPPCECGWRWTGEAVGKRARQSVQVPGPLEYKAGR